MMALVAAVMMSANMAAQTDEQPQQPVMDKAEMVKMRTEQMVKEYELTEEQAAQLLTLNTDFFDKMPMMMGPGMRNGQRPQRGGDMRPPRGQRGQNGEARPQNGEMRPQMPQRPDSTGRWMQGRPMNRGDRPGFGQGDMRKVMEDYNEGLKKIFTEDQFKKYEESMNNRRQQMRRGPRGMRPNPQQMEPQSAQ